MRVAILCPGPSLSSWSLDRFDGYDITIGVNRAATVYPVHYWCFADRWIFEQVKPLGNPRPYTIRNTAVMLMGNARFMAHDFGLWEDAAKALPPVDSRPFRWLTYSVCGALMLGHWRGATHIDLYGNDRAAKAADFDGFDSPMFVRDGERWRREVEIFEYVTGFLASRGVAVRNVRPPVAVMA